MSETLQHLVLVRHGESEGDVRRAAWKRGEEVSGVKRPEQEEITIKGVEQSRRAGIWVQRHIVEAYNLTAFDGCYVSSAIRSKQSAVALGLQVAVWQEDNCLDERNRGSIRGLHAKQHQLRYPDSFKQMKNNQLHWLPPGGETLIPDVTDRVSQFLDNIEGARTVLAVTHRDWIWAAQMILEHLNEAELLSVNTDELHNAQVIEYTSINPVTGEQAPALLWKRSIDPAHITGQDEWHILTNVHELYPLAT